jgi:uncharacterized membrane protein
MKAMGDKFIIPNWHVILIHFPMGVFMLGLLLEVLFLLFRYHGSARLAARWMVVLGALASLPAAYSGMYAMADVARSSAPDADHHAPWHEVTRASTLSNDQWELLDSHAWTNGGSAVIAAVLVTLAVGCSDLWRKRLYPLFLLLLLGCAGTMTLGAFYGGEMVYRQGIGVNTTGHKHESSHAGTPVERDVEFYVTPLQLHVTLAGIVAAMGMLGIGLSLRATSTSPHWQDPELERAGVSAMPNPQRGGPEDMMVLRSFAPQVEITGEIERVPAGRFWLLTFLLAAGTALAGWWVLGGELGTYRPQDLWKQVTSDGHIRQLAHVIVGVSIVVLPLLMALLARVARRRRGTTALFSLLLVLALAAQVWLGALLMFDQHDAKSSPWYRFQQPGPGSPDR